MASAQAGCTPAGSTGFTAVVVAHHGQTISGTINASGCDLGVYVGPGITGVTVAGATITGATRHAILVQNTAGVAIVHNTVKNNEPTGETSEESKAIQLEGTNGVTVSQNVVSNNGGGGIAVLDDGPSTPDGLASAGVVPSRNNLIVQNNVTDNTNGCGIVVAAYSQGGGVISNRVVGNTVENNPAGIVVATDRLNTIATGNQVVNNTSVDNGFAGVIIHSNAPGDVVSATAVTNNTVSHNGSPQPSIGILVATGAPTSKLTGTSIVANRICNENVPIATIGDTGTRQVANKTC